MSNIPMAAEDRVADLRARLPPEARARFEALQQAAADAHVLSLAANEAALDARADLRLLEQELERTKGAVRRNEDIEESIKRRIAAARVELGRRQKIAAEHESRWTPLSRLLTNIVEQ